MGLGWALRGVQIAPKARGTHEASRKAGHTRLFLTLRQGFMQTCRYRPGVSALMCSFCCLFFLKAVPFGFDHCHAFPGLELPPRAGSPPFAGFLPFADHALVGLPALHWLSCFRPFAGSLLFEGFPLQAFAPPWAPCPSRPSCPSQAHCPWRTSCTGALCGLSALRGVSTLFRAFAACSQIL